MVFLLTFAFYSGPNYRFLLFNHSSNSISYNSNLQNLVHNTSLGDVQLLVVGSSLSLNDISGAMLEDSLKCKVYNLSSWGFRSDKILGFFSKVKLAGCKTVVMGFNNIDFGINAGATYDFGLSDSYLNGAGCDRICGFIRTFNFLEFNDAFLQRKSSAVRNDQYFALGFDRHGSVLLDTPGFKIDAYRWGHTTDTLGFGIFLKNVTALKDLLRSKNIRLWIAYLPYRRDVITPELRNHDDAVTQTLRNALADNFIDLHDVTVPKDFYADVSHMFKPGAEFITSTIIDSIRR